MKKIILSFAILAALLSSCSDFLKEDNLSNVTAESFYLTPDGFEALVNANYSQLRDVYGDAPWLFCAGTDLYAEGRNPEPIGLSQYTDLNPSAEGVAALYNTCYGAIRTANMGLYYADLTEQTASVSKRIGEIKYLRANAYFLLVQTYGGVALVKEYISSPELSFERNSAQEVYAFVISELEAALSAVDDGAYTGRVNKRAVQHLLAKVHLTRGYEAFAANDDFAKAASYADAAINNQGLTLSFADVWKPGNEMNAEVLFSVQFSAASVSADPQKLGSRQAHYFGSYMGGAESAGKAPYRSYTLCATPYAVNLFEEGDTRWEGTFMVEAYERYYDYYDVADHSALTAKHFYEPKWFTAEDKAAYLLENPKMEIEGSGYQYHAYGTYVSDGKVFSADWESISIRKFDDPTSPFGQGRVSTRDIVLSRLAETYLIAAEAYLKVGNATTGLARLNVVRARAGVADATPAEFNIDYILDERGRELMGEYHRWFDLKRTGTLIARASAHHHLIDAANFDGANGEKKILRPIPQEALDLNQNKNFAQNPAYN